MHLFNQSARYLFFTCLLGCIFSLSACSTQKPIRSSALSYRGIQSSPDMAEVKLAEAAASVSHSLQKIAAIETATHPTVKLPTPPNPGRIGMAQIISVDWTGPAEPFIKKIAKISHYKFHVLGSKPAIPPIISVTAKDVLLADVLRDVEYQIAKKARVKVYSQTHVIELRYVSS